MASLIRHGRVGLRDHLRSRTGANRAR